MIQKSIVTHYQLNLPLVLSVDASAEGIGAVLQHQYDNGALKPIAAVALMLTQSEKNYSTSD